MILSQIAHNIIGSEIIKLAAEVQDRIRAGQKIYNLTIGDFDPQQFPIPAVLKGFIIEELNKGETNYPTAEGMLELRQAVAKYYRERLGPEFNPADEILIAAGARPVIYAIFKTLVDSGDRILIPVPSWNNNHYTTLMDATPAFIITKPENRFLPMAHEIEPNISCHQLLCLCSPQNPTGTMYTKEELEAICDLVIAENKRRGPKEKPLYVMFDQIYWMLSLSDTVHYDPVSLRPEMRDYTIYVDGISKSLSATGVRVGWAAGPKAIIGKMKSILSHIGAWAPRAEQIATGRFLMNGGAHDEFIVKQRLKVDDRLWTFYEGFSRMRQLDLGVDVISPQGGIYLSVKFDLFGKEYDGKLIETSQDIVQFLLDKAGVAIVPFSAFGVPANSDWFRVSIGTVSIEDIPAIIKALTVALLAIHNDDEI